MKEHERTLVHIGIGWNMIRNPIDWSSLRSSRVLFHVITQCFFMLSTWNVSNIYLVCYHIEWTSIYNIVAYFSCSTSHVKKTFTWTPSTSHCRGRFTVGGSKFWSSKNGMISKHDRDLAVSFGTTYIIKCPEGEYDADLEFAVSTRAILYVVSLFRSLTRISLLVARGEKLEPIFHDLY